MLKIAVFGANGRMGRAVTRVVSASADAEIVGACTEAGHETVGQDVGELAGLGSLGVVVTADAAEALANADVAIDFTLPAAVSGNLAACRESGCALVMGTTGLAAEHVAMIDEASEEISILYGRNLSIGVNVFTELARQAASYLDGEWDVEITEAHHRYKLDAPSGTALQLGEAVADVRGHRTWMTWQLLGAAVIPANARAERSALARFGPGISLAIIRLLSYQIQKPLS